MKNNIDSLRVKLIDQKDSITKDSNFIIIEYPQSKINQKDFYETPIFLTFILPIIIIGINFLIARWWFKKKGQIEVEKIEVEIEQIKKSFQPLVLSTLQKTQEYLLKDKIDGLKAIAFLKQHIYSLKQEYYDGIPRHEDIYDYYNSIYQKIDDSIIQEIELIVAEKSYLYSSEIKNKLSSVRSNLIRVFNIQKKEFSVRKPEMPKEAERLLKDAANSFDFIIDSIRTDLHIDNTFVHDFIRTYKE